MSAFLWNDGMQRQDERPRTDLLGGGLLDLGGLRLLLVARLGLGRLVVRLLDGRRRRGRLLLLDFGRKPTMEDNNCPKVPKVSVML